ncbi:uncharacterized protein LOC104896000 [Beta vulgaris subsp. vulgaris]|uniref:uncharacterized protein LOC104896000 n=1 Tax=Beta vulgaris subsp. vulgaris TaxID=3555 RepID=UPI002036F286|nr:uncharacterized protein LOC104896000 [Beta vulgaris subsp. vulgaris]
MASTASYLRHHYTPLHPIRNSVSNTPQRTNARIPSASRRDYLLFTATTVLTAVNLPSANAKDIPLFGLRKRLEKAEEQAEELVKEGLETVEKGVETAEKGVVEAEKQIENAAESGSFSGLAQAGLVAGAELLGVLVATSIVNGILGPEPKKV